MMNATAAMLDPDLAGGAIGIIAALGQCGSAIFPWVTGALAGRYGVWALQRECCLSILIALDLTDLLTPPSFVVGNDRAEWIAMGRRSLD